MPGPTTRYPKRVTALFSPEQVEAMKVRAEKESISLSAWIRQQALSSLAADDYIRFPDGTKQSSNNPDSDYDGTQLDFSES